MNTNPPLDLAATPRRWFRNIAFATLAQLYFTAVFFVFAPLALLWWAGRSPLPRWDVQTFLGLAIVLGANGVVVHLVRQFVRQGGGTQVPIDPPRLMVTSGVYRRSRNPMYFAYVVTLFGEALIAHWWGLVTYALLFWAAFHAYVLFREEPLLLARFGNDYSNYAAAVPRWFGRARRAAADARRGERPRP